MHTILLVVLLLILIEVLFTLVLKLSVIVVVQFYVLMINSVLDVETLFNLHHIVLQNLIQLLLHHKSLHINLKLLIPLHNNKERLLLNRKMERKRSLLSVQNVVLLYMIMKLGAITVIEYYLLPNLLVNQNKLQLLLEKLLLELHDANVVML